MPKSILATQILGKLEPNHRNIQVMSTRRPTFIFSSKVSCDRWWYSRTKPSKNPSWLIIGWGVVQARVGARAREGMVIISLPHTWDNIEIFDYVSHTWDNIDRYYDVYTSYFIYILLVPLMACITLYNTLFVLFNVLNITKISKIYCMIYIVLHHAHIIRHLK